MTCGNGETLLEGCDIGGLSGIGVNDVACVDCAVMDYYYCAIDDTALVDDHALLDDGGTFYYEYLDIDTAGSDF